MGKSQVNGDAREWDQEEGRAGLVLWAMVRAPQVASLSLTRELVIQSAFPK